MTGRSIPSRGFSLVELMVAMVIGLVLMLAVSMLVARQEAIRRSVSSGNDLIGGTAYAAYSLDRELRAAGSGISQAVAQSYGCLLHASLQSSQLLPRLKPFPQPFSAVPQAFRLAPLVVHAGAGAHGSDVIAIAAGHSGLSEAPLPVVPKSAEPGRLQLANTLGMRGGELLLLTQGSAGCMLQQVGADFVGGAAQQVSLGGLYAADTIDGLSITEFSSQAFAFLLGNATGNRPRLQLLGIDADDALVSYDLLQLGSDEVQPLAEGVADMRVLYGVDMARQGLRQVTQWIAPTASGFTAAELTNGSVAARGNLQHILAVRVALVLRSDLVEKADVTPATLTLFAELPQAMRRTYTVPPGTANQRYRVVEFTVPLRNVRYSR
jgi:type IV pilus assembly protein PilW